MWFYNCQKIEFLCVGKHNSTEQRAHTRNTESFCADNNAYYKDILHMHLHIYIYPYGYVYRDICTNIKN